MKKICALSLALSLAVSASAHTQLAQAMPQRVAVKQVKQSMPADYQSGVAAASTMALRDDTSIEALEGEYDWTFYNYMKGANGTFTEKLSIVVVDAERGEVVVDFTGWKVKGIYDEDNCVLSIDANQYIETVNMTIDNEQVDVDIYLYHGVWLANGYNGGFVDRPFEITFTGSALAFPTIEGTGDLAGSIFAEDNIVIGNDPKGWYLYAGDNVAVKNFPFEEEMPLGEWKSVGKGLFTDSWQMISYVGMKYTDEQFKWEVDVEQNSVNPAIYRIHNPYNTPDCMLYEYNFDMKGTGNIVFSVEDPEFVMVYPHIYSGMSDEYGEYLNFNLEGFYTLLYDVSRETLIEKNVLEDGISNYADGMVTFLNCYFATTAAPDKPRSWQIGYGPSYLEIELPYAGVDIIGVDDSYAPVEYYNLQGIRVAEPANGLYIMRQGTRVSKVVK